MPGQRRLQKQCAVGEPRTAIAPGRPAEAGFVEPLRPARERILVVEKRRTGEVLRFPQARADRGSADRDQMVGEQRLGAHSGPGTATGAEREVDSFGTDGGGRLALGHPDFDVRMQRPERPEPGKQPERGERRRCAHADDVPGPG